MAKLGSVFDIKGFIMNKLFEKGCVTTGHHHGKHMPLKDLSHSYPPQYHGLFPRAIDELKREGRILVFPARTGRGTDDHVAVMKKSLVPSRPLINAYRRRAGMAPYNRDLTALLKR